MKNERLMTMDPSRAAAAMLIAAVSLLGLSGCGRPGADWRQPHPSDQAAPAEADYIRPPRVTAVTADASGAVVVSGRSEPMVTVRLSSPGGEAHGSTAGPDGAWSVAAPASGDVREFGLSEVIGDRVVQSEGYVAVIPGGRPAAVLLRAGTGSIALAAADGALHLRTVDFDTGGGATVAGVAKPGAAIHLILDGVSAGDAHADTAGRFAITASVLMKPGDHQLVVETPTAADEAKVAVSAPAPISGLPFHATRLAGGWRIDWLTPGGSVQCTVILDEAERKP
jgi:hypothetical protein